MRVLTLTALAIALAPMAACNKPAPSAANTSAPPPSSVIPAPASSAVASSAAALSAAPANAIAAQDLPHRKAGLWRQTLVLAGSNKPAPVTQACSDAASEAKLNLLGQRKDEPRCQSQQFTRNPDGSIGFTIRCAMTMGGQNLNTGTIRGDLNKSYTITMDSKTTGQPDAWMNTEHRMTIATTWIGACAPGQRGGDMTTADGRTINLTDKIPKPR
jgi:hypothetical protein